MSRAHGRGSGAAVWRKFFPGERAAETEPEGQVPDLLEGQEVTERTSALLILLVREPMLGGASKTIYVEIFM